MWPASGGSHAIKAFVNGNAGPGDASVTYTGAGLLPFDLRSSGTNSTVIQAESLNGNAHIDASGNLSSSGNSNDFFFGLFAQTGATSQPAGTHARRRICNLPQRHDHHTRKQFRRHLRGSTSERVGPNYHPARHHDHRQRQQPGGSFGPGNRCRPIWHRGGWQEDNGGRGVDHYDAREPRSRFQSYQRPNRHSGAEQITTIPRQSS